MRLWWWWPDSAHQTSPAVSFTTSWRSILVWTFPDSPKPSASKAICIGTNQTSPHCRAIRAAPVCTFRICGCNSLPPPTAIQMAPPPCKHCTTWSRDIPFVTCKHLSITFVYLGWSNSKLKSYSCVEILTLWKKCPESQMRYQIRNIHPCCRTESGIFLSTTTHQGQSFAESSSIAECTCRWILWAFPNNINYLKCQVPLFFPWPQSCSNQFCVKQ